MLTAIILREPIKSTIPRPSYYYYYHSEGTWGLRRHSDWSRSQGEFVWIELRKSVVNSKLLIFHLKFGDTFVSLFVLLSEDPCIPATLPLHVHHYGLWKLCTMPTEAKERKQHFSQFKYLLNIATHVFIYSLLSSISLISLRERLESKKVTTINCWNTTQKLVVRLKFFSDTRKMNDHLKTTF